MKIETIIKREDGSRVRIITSLRDNYGTPSYQSTVHICDKGKRTWYGTFSSDDYTFRRLEMNKREAFIKESNLKYVTEQELHQAKIDLWEYIKP